MGKMKKGKKVSLIVLMAMLVGAGIWVGMMKFEWTKPTLQLLPDSRYVSQKLSFKVEDQKSGVAEVCVEVVQQGKTVTLLVEHFPRETRRVEKTLLLKPLPQGLKEGEAQLRISARDHSWNRNSVVMGKDVIIDTIAPQVTILGALHYINKGGTGVVTYTTTEDTPVSGVQIGDLFSRGTQRARIDTLLILRSPTTQLGMPRFP